MQYKNVTTPEVILSEPRCWVKWQLLTLTCDKVAALEGLFKLLWVFVLAIPDWVPLTVKVLPEVGNGYCQGVLVGILSLELVHDKCTKEKKGEVHIGLQTKTRYGKIGKQQWTIAVCHLRAHIIEVCIFKKNKKLTCYRKHTEPSPACRGGFS